MGDITEVKENGPTFRGDLTKLFLFLKFNNNDKINNVNNNRNKK